ncbi:EcsC family protein [Pseudanabaenaceae cyanobacterium LEGE 13415]|nr:EcsC family protein [Pseudanabaenaceae cyanobacterium LEGE 13415]
METALEVAHTVPGRIRVRLPVLKRHPEYETVLQTQVQSLNSVKAVRVNSTARSMIVQYDPRLTSEKSFTTKLLDAIEPICLTESKPLDRKLPLDCEPIHLTTYEAVQFEAIKAWKHRQISELKEIIGRLLLASRALINFFFLNKVLEKIASLCEQTTANWQQDWEKLKSSTDVEQFNDLRRGTLESCDRLSEQVTKAAQSQAALQGSLSGLFDVFGEVADEGLTLVLALQTIHRIGLCYGYAPQTSDEQAFAWAIFNAAIAQTQEEFENTQITIRQLQRSLNKQALEDETLQDTLEEDVEDLLVDSAIEQGIAQLSGETLGGIVPILSIVMNLFADRHLIDDISEAATREFQQRWLLENRKIRFPKLSTGGSYDFNAASSTGNSPKTD